MDVGNVECLDKWKISVCSLSILCTAAKAVSNLNFLRLS